MKTYALTIGLVVRHGERTWRLERQLDDAASTLVFVDQITGTPKTMTPSTLQADVLKGQLAIVTGEAPEVSSGQQVTAPLVATLEDLPAHKRQQVENRYRYVMHMHRRGIRRGMRSQIRAELKALGGHLPPRHTDEQEVPDPAVPSPSSVMDWMRRHEESGGNLLSLLPRHAMRRSPRRLDEAVLQICRDHVRTYYCSRQRPTIAATRLRINAAIAAKGSAPQNSPSSVSISTVRRCIEEIDPHARDIARFGRAFARNKWRYSLHGLDVSRPLERYEIDHTIVDVVVVSDSTAMPLGRPTITAVVDAFSGLVAGFFVSFWSTGLATTIAALKVAISPKDAICEAQGLAAKWLPYGIPNLLVCDNGLEFHSPQFHAVAMHLSIDLRFCAVRQPWLKPMVERTFGSYLSYLPTQGRVEKRLDNYLPLKPEKTATITFSALCQGLLKAFVEIHPFEINQRRLSLPYDRFAEGMAKMLPPRLPSSTAELDIIAAQSQQLTIGAEGAVMRHLRYNSAELVELRKRIGTSFKTTVKYNPEDLGAVYIQDPTCRQWMWVPSCHPEYTAGLSIVQHRATCALIKEKLERRDIPNQLCRAKLQLMDMWNARAAVGKRLKSAQLRALASLTSSHALLGPEVSASPGSTQPTPSQLVTVQELEVDEPDIPDFQAFQLV